MSNDIKFAEGVYFKEPSENAPDFVFGKISLRRQQVIDWLSGLDEEWVNLDVKESKGGKIYCAVDNWKPDNQRGQQHSRQRDERPQRQERQGYNQTPQRQAPQQSAPIDDFSDDDIPF